MDASSIAPRPRLIGERDSYWWADWHFAQGLWLSAHRLQMTWYFVDHFALVPETRTLIGELDEEQGIITWGNGSDLRFGLHQILSTRKWYRCAVHPTKCARAPVRYVQEATTESDFNAGQVCGRRRLNYRHSHHLSSLTAADAHDPPPLACACSLPTS